MTHKVDYTLDFIVSHGVDTSQAEDITLECLAAVAEKHSLRSMEDAKNTVERELELYRTSEPGHWLPLFPYFYLYSDLTAHELFQWWKDSFSPKRVFQNKVKYQPPNKTVLIPFNPFKRDGTFVVIDSSHVPYERESITDFYTECVRMDAKRHFMAKTPMEMWIASGRHDTFVQEYHSLTKAQIKRYREDVYKMSKETTLFRISWARSLYLLLGAGKKNLKILDPCAGWGDRMIAALSVGAMYHGVDPSAALHGMYKNIAKDFDPLGKSHVTKSPFEDYTIEDPGTYDIVFTSPPYFTMELYSNEEDQSTGRYESFDQWTTGFLHPLLKGSAEACAPGGYIAIHIANYKIGNREIPLVESVFSTSRKIPSMNYKGIVFLRGESQRDWPVWIWQKTPIG